MNSGASNSDRLDTLTALASGIIPSDQRDGGVVGCAGWPKLISRLDSPPYGNGLEIAERLAKQKFQRAVRDLSSSEICDLLRFLRDEAPGFFKQLRMDVSAIYLGDPAVWQRIGFPGPSIASGGYADFDRPQTRTMNEMKEPDSAHPPQPKAS